MTDSFNIVTVGDTYKASVTCDGKLHVVSFYIGTRQGATADMIRETLRHFISAISSVANGDVDAAEGMVTPRTGYGDCPHSEARVSIWVKAPGIPVLLEQGMRFLQVNVFTEATSAQDFVDAVNCHVNAMSIIIDSGAIQLANGAPKQAQPASELDKHFGPRQETPQAPVNDTSYKPEAPPALHMYDRLPQDRREALEADGSVKQVKLIISAVENKTINFDDGNSKQVIRFWRVDGEHPYNYRFDATVDERDNNYTLKNVKNSGLFTLVPEVGYKAPAKGVATFKKTIGEGKYEGKVFWNFASFTPVEDTPEPTEQPQAPISESEPADAGFEFDPPPANAADIPF